MGKRAFFKKAKQGARKHGGKIGGGGGKSVLAPQGLGSLLNTIVVGPEQNRGHPRGVSFWRGLLKTGTQNPPPHCKLGRARGPRGENNKPAAPGTAFRIGEKNYSRQKSEPFGPAPVYPETGPGSTEKFGGGGDVQKKGTAGKKLFFSPRG